MCSSDLPKPRRCAKPSRKPTLLSLRGRLMAGEWQGSSDGKVTGRGGLSILGLHPKPRRCAKLSHWPNPAFAPQPPDGGESARFKRVKVTGRGGPLMWTSRGKVQARRCAGKGVAIALASSEQPFVKFTCARRLLIINKLRSLNCAGEHNLLPPATL